LLLRDGRVRASGRMSARDLTGEKHDGERQARSARERIQLRSRRSRPAQTGYSVGTLDRFDGVGPARGIDPGRGDGARDPKCRRVVLM
jgi:hypothetical protein